MKLRIAVAVLSLSAAGLVGLVSREGYTDRAVIPTQGDVPTVGFGSTKHPDGAAVKMGDSTDPVRALIAAGAHVGETERALRKCIGDVPMYQHEWDTIVSWAYNVGPTAACKSTLIRKLKALDYEGACNELPRWKFVAGREVRGLAVRRERERQQCLGLVSVGASQGSEKFLAALPDLVAMPQGSVGNADPDAPFLEREPLSAVLIDAAIPTVPDLLGSTGPAAVGGGVVAVIVDALDGHALRSNSHVGEEVVEGLPAFADLDASASVVTEASGFRVFASLAQADPDVVRRGVGQAVTDRAFRFQAATGLRAPVAQVGAVAFDGVAALTLHEPARATAAPSWKALDALQAPELSAS